MTFISTNLSPVANLVLGEVLHNLHDGRVVLATLLRRLLLQIREFFFCLLDEPGEAISLLSINPILLAVLVEYLLDRCDVSGIEIVEIVECLGRFGASAADLTQITRMFVTRTGSLILRFRVDAPATTPLSSCSCPHHPPEIPPFPP